MVEIVKKCFLQSCINFGCIRTSNAGEILKRICDLNGIELIDIKKVTEFINSEILQFDHSLAFVRHPINNEEFLVFFLKSATKSAKLSLNYTDEDRRYFSKLLETIILEDDYGISIFDTFHVLDDETIGKQLPKIRMKNLVDTWTNQGYFILNNDKIYFGPRMVLEYGNHFRSKYPQSINECPLCFQIVFWGNKCSLCNGKLHKECIGKFLIRNSHCPTCKGFWNTPLT